MSPNHATLVEQVESYEHVEEHTRAAAITWLNVIFAAGGAGYQVTVDEDKGKILIGVVGKLDTARLVVEPN